MRRLDPAEELGVELLHRKVGDGAIHQDGDVAPAGPLGDHLNRNARRAQRPEHPLQDLVAASHVADEAEHRMLRRDADGGNATQLLLQAGQAVRHPRLAPQLGGVQRHGDAHLAGGHHVHRHLVGGHHSKHLCQKAVLAQHAGGHNVKHAHILLPHHRGQQAGAHVPVPGDECPRGSHVVAVLHPNIQVTLAADGRLHGQRVQHLGPEIRQLRRLLVRQERDGDSIGGDAGVCSQHPVHVLPHLHLIHAQRPAQHRGGQVGAATAEGGDGAALLALR